MEITSIYQSMMLQIARYFIQKTMHKRSHSNSSYEALEYAYDSIWIIAKSGSKDNPNSQYWIVEKGFKLKIIQENDSKIHVIKSHIFKPFDSTKFVQSLFSKKH